MKATGCGLLLLAAGLLSACGSEPTTQGSLPSGPGFESRFPDESIQDWISYGQQVAVIYVVSERELPPPLSRSDGGSGLDNAPEGYISRLLTLRIEETLWAAPGFDPAAGEIEYVDWGWTRKDGKLALLFPASSMKVGERYVLPLTSVWPEGPDDAWLSPWASLSPLSLPLAGAALDASLGQSGSWQRELAGMSIGDLRLLLAATPPDPIAARFMDLVPQERVGAVARARSLAEATPAQGD